MNESYSNVTHTHFRKSDLMRQSLPVYEYELWQKILFGLFMFPIIFFSIVGNILVIVAISKYSFLKITHNMFLASLAIADLLVALTAMVLNSFLHTILKILSLKLNLKTLNALQLLSGHWYLRSFMCRLWFCCDVLFSTASILNLFCVSFDCYMSISNRFSFYYTAEHPTKSRRVRVMISSVWLISLLISSVPIFTDMFTTEENSALINKLDFEYGQCMFITNVPYRLLSSFISFWLPATGMIIFYLLVMKKANKMEISKHQLYVSINPHDKDSKAVAMRKIWRREYKVSLYFLGFI